MKLVEAEIRGGTKAYADVSKGKENMNEYSVLGQRINSFVVTMYTVAT